MQSVDKEVRDARPQHCRDQSQILVVRRSTEPHHSQKEYERRAESDLCAKKFNEISQIEVAAGDAPELEDVGRPAMLGVPNQVGSVKNQSDQSTGIRPRRSEPPPRLGIDDRPTESARREKQCGEFREQREAASDTDSQPPAPIR